MSEPEVMQGRLGWESGDISEADPDELTPHPKNREIYGDTETSDDLDDTFFESVAEKGVLEPLVITDGKQIISGHRRWLAAQEAGLETVPVRYSEFDSDLAEREALIEFNRQREKTPGQIVNEFEEILDIERQRAKDRQGKRTDLEEGTSCESSQEVKPARDEAAKKVNANVSGETLEKGLKVKEKAEDPETPQPVREKAREEWGKMQTGERRGFGTALKEVEKAEAEAEVADQEEPDTEYPPLVRKQDATEFLHEVEAPDLVIADPPYSTDLDDVTAFAKSWVPAMIDAIGDGGQAFVFIGAYPEELQAYLNVLSVHGVRERTQVLVWTYRNTLGQTPSDRYKLNWQAILFIQSDPPDDLNAPKTSEQWAVQDVNAPDARTGDRHHKWEKPGDLINRFIRHTTDEGDLVVDPFAGTGTTVLKAAQLGRETVGVDTDPEMLEIANQRGCIRGDSDGR